MGETADDAEKERGKYTRMWEVEDYRTVSPGFLALTQLSVLNAFRNFGVRTILDAGCGSGKASQYLMETFPGEFEVRGFDIADNCLDPYFDDKRDWFLTVGCLWDENDLRTTYDAVVCVDVMEHIPPERVPATLANLCRITGKVAFFGIALQPDEFGPAVIGEQLHLTIEPPDWWKDRLSEAGYRTLWSSVVDAGGTPGWVLCVVEPGGGAEGV